MNNLRIAPSELPFRWKGQNYQIIECGIEKDEPYAKVDPQNSELEEEIKNRINRDKGLTVYLGLNYVCFIEDYRG